MRFQTMWKRCVQLAAALALVAGDAVVDERVTKCDVKTRQPTMSYRIAFYNSRISI